MVHSTARGIRYIFTNSALYLIRNKTGKCPDMTETLLTAQTMHCREIVAFLWTLFYGALDINGSMCVVWNKTHVGEVQTN